MASHDTQEQTIFEKILVKDIAADIVYEDENLMVIMDAYPMSAGHCLIIPKAKAENIYDLNEDSLKAVALMSKKLAIAIKKAMQADGIKILQNNEAAAEQSVFYYHLHVIPHYKESKQAEHYDKSGDRKALTEQAKKISAALTE